MMLLFGNMCIYIYIYIYYKNPVAIYTLKLKFLGKMREDVEACVQSCLICQLDKTKRRKQQGCCSISLSQRDLRRTTNGLHWSLSKGRGIQIYIHGSRQVLQICHLHTFTTCMPHGGGRQAILQPQSSASGCLKTQSMITMLGSLVGFRSNYSNSQVGS